NVIHAHLHRHIESKRASETIPKDPCYPESAVITIGSHPLRPNPGTAISASPNPGASLQRSGAVSRRLSQLTYRSVTTKSLESAFHPRVQARWKFALDGRS
ncbi:MAG: hypothetical protein M1816_005941, partial [Peltula sp. TS41687]